MCPSWTHARLPFVGKRGILALLLVPPQRREVNSVENFVTVMISVMANVIAYFVCKWLDRNR